MAWATPAWRGNAGTASYTASTVASPTTLTPALPATWSPGNLLIIATACRSATPTVATPAGWKQLLNTTGTNGRLALFGKIAVTGESTPNVTWSGLTTGTSGTPAGAIVTAYSGAQLYIESTGTVENGIAATTTSAGGAAVTPTSANALILSLSTRLDDAGTWSAGANYALALSGGTTSGLDFSLAMQHRILASPASETPPDFGLASASSFASSGCAIALRPMQTQALTTTPVTCSETFTKKPKVKDTFTVSAIEAVTRKVKITESATVTVLESVSRKAKRAFSAAVGVIASSAAARSLSRVLDFTVTTSATVRRFPKRTLTMAVDAVASFGKSFPVARDTFTDTASLALHNHTSDSGHTWAKHPLVGGTFSISDVNRARCSAGPATYTLSAAVSSPDHDVEADFYVLSVAGSQGIVARWSPTVVTGYYARYNGVSTLAWELYKYVTGTPTLLGSFPQTLNVGQSYHIKLVVRDGYKAVEIDDTEVIRSTDNALAGGATGLRNGTAATNSTGIHVDNFKVSRPAVNIVRQVLNAVVGLVSDAWRTPKVTESATVTVSPTIRRKVYRRFTAVVSGLADLATRKIAAIGPVRLTLDFVVTTSPTLKRKVRKTLAAVTTTSTSLKRKARKTLTAITTASPSLKRKARKTLSAATTTSPSLKRKTRKTLTATAVADATVRRFVRVRPSAVVGLVGTLATQTLGGFRAVRIVAGHVRALMARTGHNTAVRIHSGHMQTTVPIVSIGDEPAVRIEHGHTHV